jgi:N,N'-diacetyllegionaminate synthase
LRRTLIIAEAGVNHNGSMELAKKLIDTAKDAGADMVKFQSFKAENLVSKTAKKADYQLNNTDRSESQFDMLKKLELNYDQHIEMIRYCKSKQIEFLSTPFDEESIELLKKLGIKTGKIPSGEITNLPYLKKMAASFGSLILSTGMSNMNEIRDALGVLTSSGVSAMENITVLHCNTEYPTPFEDVNLNAMQTIADEFSVKVGYSDHTPGIEVSIAAVALGALVIEKHFTLDRNLDGPDHKASLEPAELKTMVQSIRHVELAMGRPKKEPTPSELKNRAIARRSIVAARDIAAGEIFTESNLTTKRPGTGISPMLWDQLIGKMAIRNFTQDEIIER